MGACVSHIETIVCNHALKCSEEGWVKDKNTQHYISLFMASKMGKL